MMRFVVCSTLLVLFAASLRLSSAQEGPNDSASTELVSEANAGTAAEAGAADNTSPISGINVLKQRPKLPLGVDKTLVNDVPAVKPQVATVLCVYRLHSASAANLASTLEQLFRDPQIVISADQVTNSLLVKAPSSIQETIKSILQTVDSPPEKRQSERISSPHPGDSQNDERDLARLKQRYQRLEGETEAIVERLRKSPDQSDFLRTNLRAAVEEAFATRQRLHHKELAIFQRRMEQIEQTIRIRDELKNQIIDRRVQDLINPNLKWDSTSHIKPVTNSTARVSGTNDPSTLATTHLVISRPPGLNVSALDAEQPESQPSKSNDRASSTLNSSKYQIGKTYRFVLLESVQNTDLAVPFSIQFPPVSAETQAFLKDKTLRIEIVGEDVRQVLAGNKLVKAIYVTHIPGQPLDVSKVSTMVNTRTGPEVDVIAQAGLRGTVLVVLQMSGITRIPGESLIKDAVDHPVSLTEAVGRFNQWMQEHAEFQLRQLLTDDEVIASIRWAGLSPRPASISEADWDILRQIAENRVLPAGWRLNLVHRSASRRAAGQAIELAAKSESPARVAEIVLERGASFGTLGVTQLIRQEFITPAMSTAIVPDEEPVNPGPNSTPLSAAVEEFNQIYAREKQPPLTVSEVVAAIDDWRSHRDDAPVTNGEFAELVDVGTLRQLPEGGHLQLLQKFQPNSEYTFDLWSIRVVLNRRSKPGSTYGYTIRERFMTSTRLATKEISYGPTAANGLQVGVRFQSRADEYTSGTQVTPMFYFRNAGKEQLEGSFPNLMSHSQYRLLDVRDSAGSQIPVLNNPEPGLVAGARRVSLPPGASHEVRGMPILIGDVPLEPGVDAVIQAKPGQSCRVRFVMPNPIEQREISQAEQREISQAEQREISQAEQREISQAEQREISEAPELTTGEVRFDIQTGASQE